MCFYSALLTLANVFILELLLILIVIKPILDSVTLCYVCVLAIRGIIEQERYCPINIGISKLYMFSPISGVLNVYYD